VEPPFAAVITDSRLPIPIRSLPPLNNAGCANPTAHSPTARLAANPTEPCDGGYTRLLPRRYEDGSGYYLKLIPTGSEEGQEKAKKAFSDAYELQQEVCRVLGTEPAGETAIVVQEAHRKPSEAEQLAIDIKRGGGRANSLTAGHLIRMATQHQQMMVDYCNGVDIYDQDGEPVPELAQAAEDHRSSRQGCWL
jgi:hypothetical protein